MDEYGLDDLTRAVGARSAANPKRAMRAKIARVPRWHLPQPDPGRRLRRPGRVRRARRRQGRQRRDRFRRHVGMRARRRQRAALLHQRDGAARDQVADAAVDPEQRGLRRADQGDGAGGLHPQRAAALPDRRPARHGPLRHAADLRRARRCGARSRAGRFRHDEPHHVPGTTTRRPGLLLPLFRVRRLRRARWARRLGDAAASRRTWRWCRSRSGSR